jgi:hypothetical protein
MIFRGAVKLYAVCNCINGRSASNLLAWRNEITTNPMVQALVSDVEGFSLGQEIPYFYETRMLIASFTKATIGHSCLPVEFIPGLRNLFLCIPF